MELLIAVATFAWLLGREFMGKLTTKDTSVDLSGLAPEGLTILSAVERATRVYNVDLVVTSADRDAGGTSQHETGKALDVRTSNLTTKQILALYWWLTVELGPNFVVLFETPNLNNVPPELRSIAFVNPAGSAVHFHIGAKRT